MIALEMVAITGYLAVAGCCCLAAFSSLGRSGKSRNLLHWLSCGLFFAGLAVARYIHAEDRARESLRLLLREAGRYSDRAELQIPLVVVALAASLVCMVLAWIAWRRTAENSQARMVRLAQFSILGFVGLYALRLISLHQTDMVLYSGPIRLNWLLDAGLTAMMGFAALAFFVRGSGRSWRRGSSTR